MSEQQPPQVVVRMPEDMRQAIRDIAKQNDLTVSQVVRAAVRRHLADLQPA